MNQSKLLSRGAKHLWVLALLWVPSGYRFPYETPKFFILSIALLFYAFYFWRKKITLSLFLDSPLKAGSLALISGILVSSVFAVTGELFHGLSTIALWVGLCLSFKTMMDISPPKENFLSSYIQNTIPFWMASYFIILYSLISYPQQSTHPFFGNPNVLGDFIALTSLQFFFYSEMKKGREKIIGYLFIALGFSFLIYLQSRGSIMALSLGAI